ncbi:hypothetical protein [Paenibacillus sp. KN14-4R]|uniref:hypothetical protein n=1 Tax=Paenibacillus sp. KN14-4R TaxID=3445773 RepID=UPI003F9EEB36
MRKFKEYYLTVNLADILRSPIRNKSDIVWLLLNSLEVILSEIPVADRGYGIFSLNINKMSRIFFAANIEGYMKNFSFTFPFTIHLEDNSVKKLYSTNTKIGINKTIVRILLELAAEGFFKEKEQTPNIYDEMDALSVAIKNNINVDEDLDDYEEKVWTIIKEFLLFEPGYLRYDFDEERADPDLHPLHHLDVFYSSQATFKLGLNESIFKNKLLEREDLINVLDITTPCYYISNLSIKK